MDSLQNYESGELLYYSQPYEYNFRRGKFFFAAVVLFLAIKAFLPGSRDVYYQFANLQIRLTEIVLITLGTLLIVVKLIFDSSHPCLRSTKRFFLYPFLLLGLFELISLMWSTIAGSKPIIAMNVLYMWSAATAAVFAMSGLSKERRHLFTNLLSFFMFFVIFTYIGLSFWFPSFRPSYEYIEVTLGWIRVHGPLFGAATMGMVILPTIGHCAGQFLTQGKGKLLWAILAIFFIIAIVLSGSRGGLVGIAFLLLLLILISPTKTSKFIVPLLVLVVLALLFWNIPERFRQLRDTARFESYKTGLRAFTSGPLPILIGHGHGSFYGEEAITRPSALGRARLGSRYTEYGPSLVNSHSTYLHTLVETGLIGFLLVVTPLVWLTKKYFAGKYRKIKTLEMLRARVVLAGVIATLPLMAFDHYIIQNFWIFLIWATYAVSAAEEIEQLELESSDYHDYYEEDEANNYG